VKCGTLPKSAQARAWINMILQNVNAASGRSDEKALLWVRECLDLERVDSYFASSSRRFALLDARFGAALQQMAHGELGRQISLFVEACLREGRIAKGREVFRIILRYYSTNKTADVIFQITDLQRIKLVSGNLETFQNSWLSVLQGMRKRPDDEQLELMYFEGVSSHPDLSEDVAHYRRQEEGDKDRSYTFLFNAVKRSVVRTREARMRADLHKAIGGGQPTAPGPKAKAKAEAKGWYWQ